MIFDRVRIITREHGDTTETVHTVTLADFNAWQDGRRDTEGARAIESGLSWLKENYPIIGTLVDIAARNHRAHRQVERPHS